MKKFIDIIAGARPNFIKIASVINGIKLIQGEGKKVKFRLIHTGQHYDKSMSTDFFDQLSIPKPHINLNCGSGTHATQTSKIMTSYERLLKDNKPVACIVFGDVNSTLACSVVAKKYNIQVCHVEGGIRSFDISMPEEVNRMVTDSITDYFFVTSTHAVNNLKNEGKKMKSIFFVGNTMIDTLKSHIKKISPPKDLEKLLIAKKKYILATLHRPANVDSKKTLQQIISKIGKACADINVILPVHPRAKENLKSIKVPKNIILVPPQPYLQFLYLLKNSIAVITDSGGITEEATWLKVPCLTMRENTERPETVHEGTNILIGNNYNLLDRSVKKILLKKWKKSKIPQKWDGKTGRRIAKILHDKYFK